VTSSEVIFVGNDMIINPHANLIDKGGKTYSLRMASGVIVGMGDNPYGGLNDTYQFSVSDTTPPAVSTYVPALNAVDRSKATDITLTFDENVQVGVGTVEMTSSGGSGANQAISLDITAPQITFVGNKLTVNPTDFFLDSGTKTITVVISAGAIKDVRNNVFAGISGTAYQFSVAESRVPDVPTGLDAVVTSQSTILLSWTLPFNGYSPLSGYTVYTWRESCGLDTCTAGSQGTWNLGYSTDAGVVSSGDADQPHSGTRVSVEMSCIPVDQTLKFKLQAHNDVGAGPISGEKPATMGLCRNVQVGGGVETWSCLL